MRKKKRRMKMMMIKKMQTLPKKLIPLLTQAKRRAKWTCPN